MKEELGQLDLELKGMFMENRIDDMIELLQDKPKDIVKELSEYSWNVIKKYYDTERFDLIFQHFKFVAYTCFMVEYAHQIQVISDDAFGIMMLVYNDIYELKRQQS